MKIWLKSGFVLMVILSIALVAAETPVLPYDPAAEINASLNGTMMGPYRLQVNAALPYVFFADPDKPLIRAGCYDWKLQRWEWLNRNMDRSKINLARLYTKIDLTKTKLDRDKNGNDPVAPEINKMAPVYPKIEGKLARRTEGIPPGLKYDPQAEINYQLNGEPMGPYTLQIEPVGALMFFGTDKDRPLLRAACYDWEFQYWEWTDKDFDKSKIDLKKLFRKIDLSRTTLDRPKPVSESLGGFSAVETGPYDYKNDPRFDAFIAWCKLAGTPASTLDFYLRAANHPGKRGASRPFAYGRDHSVNVIGIMMEHFKPISRKNELNGEKMRAREMVTAGGMEAYFVKHDAAHVPAANEGYSAFRDNNPVPVVVVELSPIEKPLSNEKMLRGAALQKQVKTDLESALGKECTVTVVPLQISYKRIEDCGRFPILTHMGNIMNEDVHPKIPAGTLVIYYFTDRKWLKKIDNQYSHPLPRGPYGTDWMKLRWTIIHELGHSLSLMHHFDERGGSSDLSRHISPSCIMNYKYKSNVFCELCRYGLGVDPKRFVKK